jgi:hypothetical protein
MAKCQARCDAGTYAGKNPASDCEYPWGGATLACIDKAANAGDLAIVKRCAVGCPACYDAGANCDSTSGGFSAWVASEINQHTPIDSVEIFVSLEYTYSLVCSDENTLEPAEAACRAGMDAAGGKYFVAFSKCLAKCRYAQVKGQLALDLDPCRPPAADPSTASCYAKARAKFDAKCVASCQDPPDCGPGVFPACFDWAQRIELNSLYYDRIPSPSPPGGEPRLLPVAERGVPRRVAARALRGEFGSAR